MFVRSRGCVGQLTNGPFLATSSSASMRILADLSLPYLVFVYQLTDVVNVPMQLSSVTVLANCKSAYIYIYISTVLSEMFVEASRHMYLGERDSCLRWGTVLANSKVTHSWRRALC